MAALTPDIAPQVVEACTANAEEAAGALGRAFEGEFVLKPGEPATGTPPASGNGLAIAFVFGGVGMVATLPAEGGVLPDWVREPDPTGESKLSTLAQELSMLLVPDDLMADRFEARWVDDLSAGVTATEPAGDAVVLPIELAAGERLATLTLQWPVAKADAAMSTAGAADEPAPPTEAQSDTASAAGKAAEAPAADEKPQARVLRWSGPTPRDYRDLPPHTVSALQVSVPLSVLLAKKKLHIEEIVELGPGSILTFDKSCDAPVEVAVGDVSVAEGEAVKVGDKFGVRVKQMILPDEHFRPMLPPKAS